MPVFVRAILLDAFYDLREQSQLPLGTHFQLGKFRMGHGFLEPDGSVSVIPTTTTVIPNVFFTSDPDYTYASGRMVVNCLMPKGTVADNASEPYSVVGIYSKAEDTLIAILAGAEFNVTSIDAFTVTSYIDNALAP